MEVAAAAWVILSVLSATWVAYDVITGQPAIINIMKLARVLITLYLGVIGVGSLVTYPVVPGRERSQTRHGVQEGHGCGRSRDAGVLAGLV